MSRADASRPPIASPVLVDDRARPASPGRGTRRALQAVAAMEAIKGAVVLGAGFGLLSLLHRDVRQLAVALVTRLHVDPEHHYAGLFLDAAARVTDKTLWDYAALAAAYAALRFVEAYGLFRDRRWAAWLGAASGAIYVPIELRELLAHPTLLKAAVLVFNVALVAYLLWTLRQTSKAKRPAG